MHIKVLAVQLGNPATQPKARTPPLSPAPPEGEWRGTAYGNTQSAAYAGPRQGKREVGVCALVLPSRCHSSQTALSGLYWDEKPY